jgi:hypothetical protein
MASDGKSRGDWLTPLLHAGSGGGEATPGLRAAVQLTEVLRTRFCGRNGLLGAAADCGRGELASRRALVDELGDYVPYIAYLSRLTGDPRHATWAIHQAREATRLFQSRAGLVQVPGNTDRREGEPTPLFFNVIASGDTFWGLALLQRLYGDPILGERFESLCRATIELCSSRGFVNYGVVVAGPLKLKIPLSEPMGCGYIAESMLHVYQGSKETQYLDWARGLLEPWLATASYRQYGLFTRQVTTGLPGLAALLDLQFRARRHHDLRTTRLVKGDVNLIFALLALLRVAPDDDLKRAVLSWKRSVLDRLAGPGGSFFNHWKPGSPRGWDVSLGENHSVLEVMIDIAHDLGDAEALERAGACAGFWLAHRTSEGLIPLQPRGRYAELDPQVDFAIDLLKLAELTSDAALKEDGLEIFAAIRRFFALPHGYAQRVTLDTLEPTSGRIATKFLGLLVKGFSLEHLAASGRSLLSEDGWLLAADR